MHTAALILTAWLAVSILAGLIIGRLIKAGSRYDPPTPFDTPTRDALGRAVRHGVARETTYQHTRR